MLSRNVRSARRQNQLHQGPASRELSAPSPGDDLRSKFAIRLRVSNCTQRFFLGNRLRFLCGNDTVAVAMHFAMKNGKICFSLRKFLAISPAIQKIASDCGCDAVVHSARE